jgi:hypothetical protein
MSNVIRCPQCGSDNVECKDDHGYHGHLCHDCGYTGEYPDGLGVTDPTPGDTP